mmetsp:Transcript_12237/g.36748  ORF Transcript_12237/g.36748 Transcript_12237/m.36748 type:complete len:220 (-) Transcript_12237:3065-3724(-)
MAHTSLCNTQMQLPAVQGVHLRQRSLAFRAAVPQHKASLLRQHRMQQRGDRQRMAADKGTIEEITGQQKQWEDEAAAPSAPAGEEKPGEKVEISDELKSEGEKKAEEIERLRAAEKFMRKGTGEGECRACGYVYSPKTGDDEYPIPKGTRFEELPKDWQCPTCGAAKSSFQNKELTVAGFAENQSYGLGTNSMTEGQKSALIFGSLAGFFVLFLLGYLL